MNPIRNTLAFGLLLLMAVGASGAPDSWKLLTPESADATGGVTLVVQKDLTAQELADIVAYLVSIRPAD